LAATTRRRDKLANRRAGTNTWVARVRRAVRRAAFIGRVTSSILGPNQHLMASSLNCPNCGASPEAGADATRCEYCGSVLSTTSCPSCFSPMFVGMQFCPNCGVKAARELVDDATELPCPGCATHMRDIRVG